MKYIKLIIHDQNLIKTVKTDLERQQKLNKDVKIVKIDGKFEIFTLLLKPDEVPSTVDYGYYEFTPREDNLEATVRSFYQSHDLPFNDALVEFIPKKWIIYDPVILFHANTWDAVHWQPEYEKFDRQQLFQVIADKFNVSHIAINKPIIDDNIMRIPNNILPLYGDFGPNLTVQLLEHPQPHDFQQAFWCHTLQNGIYQTWAPRFTMFSRGNIKEKKRLLDNFTKLQHTWIIDLYAGIGYFTLSYLKNGGRLICFELNPWSVEALMRNCQANGFTYKVNQPISDDDDTQVFIFHESNEYALSRIPTNIPISHINLGLLPSSQQSWGITNQLVKLSAIPTLIHVHENVHIEEFDQFKSLLHHHFPTTTFQHLTKVKTFAPDVWHIVVDLLST